MSFIRPDAEKFLRSYAEVFAGAVIMAIGTYNLTRMGWVLQFLGAVALLAGGAIAYTAYRRARFPAAQDGPGVVEVDERQISYFSAFSGGSVSIEALARISITTQDTGPIGSDMVWYLEEDGGNALQIPASASGIERLFDAFSPLSGVDYDAITAASRSTQNGTVQIWTKERAQLH
ncbi:MAG: hypothetical protein ABJ327_22075 [Litoreibacter sp.]